MELKNEEHFVHRTLEFRQAMKDFRTMFPCIDSDLIENVLRSNGGHVDSTIDQLLQLSQNPSRTCQSRRLRLQRGNHFASFDYSSESDDSIHSEILDAHSSSGDEGISIRDPPPMYTPRPGDSTDIFNSYSPIEVMDGENLRQKSKSIRNFYRSWNPPMLGTLPEDFLRILPQQFMSSPCSKEQSKKKSSSRSNMRGNTDASVKRNGDNYGHEEMNLSRNHQQRVLRSEIVQNPCPIPPPRPSRTMDTYRSRRIPVINASDRFDMNDIERGNLYIRSAVSQLGGQHPGFVSGDLQMPNSRKHSSKCLRTTHGRLLNPSCVEQGVTHPESNGNIPKRHSDFTSHRMVMVSSRASGLHMRSDVNSTHGPHPSDRDNPPHTNALKGSTICSQNLSSNSMLPLARRTRQRTHLEEEQYVEDCRLAILLQNEEFIHELRRNEEFLRALEKDRMKDTMDHSPIAALQHKPLEDNTTVPLPDPDAKYPHGSRNGAVIRQSGLDDHEKEDENAFKENLKHMGKSARKKFNEIAKKFSVKRKTSYKSLRDIDPVFANCDDNFDGIPDPRSPVFEL